MKALMIKAQEAVRLLDATQNLLEARMKELDAHLALGNTKDIELSRHAAISQFEACLDRRIDLQKVLHELNQASVK
jgi:hypothetical protein